MDLCWVLSTVDRSDVTITGNKSCFINTGMENTAGSCVAVFRGSKQLLKNGFNYSRLDFIVTFFCLVDLNLSQHT